MGDIEISQLVPFRLEKGSGLFLNLRHGFAYCYNGWQVIPDQSIDFTDHVPTSGARVVLICLSSNGTVHLVDGIVRASRSILTIHDTPNVPVHEIPLGCVLLETSQTEITQETDATDVGDFRNFLLPPAGSYEHAETELSLVQLVDVSVGTPGDGEVLYWDETNSKWQTKAVLEFSGLAKISVGTSEPSSPTAGDLWVDTN